MMSLYVVVSRGVTTKRIGKKKKKKKKRDSDMLGNGLNGNSYAATQETGLQLLD